METRARYAVIGAFTLVVIALAFGFVYWLKRLDETGIRSTVNFEFTGSVGGLAPGGAVFFAGIKVGTVTSLAFDQADPNKVFVTAEVRQDTPIKVDSNAEVGSNLLTGVAFIDIKGGSPDAVSVFDEDPPILVGSPSAIADVIGAASTTIVKIEEIVTRIDDFLKVNETAITGTARNVEAFTAALADNTDGIQDFLANVGEMSDTVAGLSERLTSVVSKADDIITAVDPDHVASIVENADRLVAGIASSTDDIEGITGRVREVADDLVVFSEGLNETLGDVRAVVDEVNAEQVNVAINNISEFTDALKQAAPNLDGLVADARATVASAKEIAANADEFAASLNARTEDVNTIIANAKDLSERLKGTSEKLDAVLERANTFLGDSGGEGQNFFQEASAAAKSIRQIAETFDLRADEIFGGVADFSGRGLSDVSSLVNELRASIARIDRAIVDLSRDPSAALFGGNSSVREYNRR
ncbi:MlaD family protein [Bauldia sp.]|uniref:MlaD family protein n=1 Tax=Bauldia sp. TaxID=2575872 RepID=UPI003BAB7796